MRKVKSVAKYYVVIALPSKGRITLPSKGRSAIRPSIEGNSPSH